MPVLPTQRVRFDAFELDTRAGELLKYGLKLKLQGHPILVLAMLLERPGDLVTREEIQQKLWPSETETFVDFEQGLNNAMRKLRQALGDEAETPQYIETLPRRGYRFVGKIVPEASGETPEHHASTPSSAQEVVAHINQSSDLSPAVAAKSRHRTRLWIALSSLVMFLSVSAAYLYYRTHRITVLTEKDTIVVADFANTTRDVVFIDTLRQGLLVQLSQSPFLKILSDDKVRTALQQMGRQPQEWLSDQLAREVCQRNQSKVFISGSIASLGSQYVLGLKAVSCQTGEVVVQQQTQVARKEDVLNALGKEASALRRKLGESLASIQKFDVPLEQATTPSLEALQAFSLARKVRWAKGETTALPFLKRAVELDPSFALAYRDMSAIYFNLDQRARAVQNATKAYQLREKVSDRERFLIEATYYHFVTGELEKSVQVYELWQQTYPRDFIPYINIGDLYIFLGNYDKPLEQWRVALRMEPDFGMNYTNLGSYYTDLNRLDEGEAMYRQAEERKLESEILLWKRYHLAFLKGDRAQMARLVSAAMGKPGNENLLLAAQADTEVWSGKLKAARALTLRAMASAQRNDAKETAAGYQAVAALREVEVGFRELGRADARAAVTLAPNLYVWALSALALAQAGDTAAAEKLAAQLDKSFPLDTMAQRFWLPTIRAAVALQRNDSNRAIELLKQTRTIEEGHLAFLRPVYVRGEAYLMLRDGDRAAAEFQRFIDQRGRVMNCPTGVVARLGLARAFAMQGDTAKAKAAYQDFLTLWKDADPDIPIYQQAKAEYAKLR